MNIHYYDSDFDQWKIQSENLMISSIQSALNCMFLAFALLKDGVV